MFRSIIRIVAATAAVTAVGAEVVARVIPSTAGVSHPIALGAGGLAVVSAAVDYGTSGFLGDPPETRTGAETRTETK